MKKRQNFRAPRIFLNALRNRFETLTQPKIIWPTHRNGASYQCRMRFAPYAYAIARAHPTASTSIIHQQNTFEGVSI